jgi:hypothetical protein
MLTIDDIRRERAMAEVIAQRDGIIINQFVEMQKAAEKNKELEAKVKSLTAEKTEE